MWQETGALAAARPSPAARNDDGGLASTMTPGKQGAMLAWTVLPILRATFLPSLI